MGRTRTKSKKSELVTTPILSDVNAASSSKRSPAKPSPSKPSPGKSTNSSQPSTKSLLSKAKSLISQCDYELGVKFIERILFRCPEHVEARELLGVVQVEVGEAELARQTFTSLLPPSTTAAPSPPPSAHLYLAQLTYDDPRAALAHYQAAVDIFVARLEPSSPTYPSPSNFLQRYPTERHQQEDVEDEEDEDGDGETVDDVKRDLVGALIAMVEIWMDPAYDLCFDPNAPSTCETLLNLALHTDPNNAEAQQALASVRLSQNKTEEALRILLHSYSIWRIHISSTSTDTHPNPHSPSSLHTPYSTTPHTNTDTDTNTNTSHIPPIPTRLSLIKMFLELSRYTEALEVIQSVMDEDDEEVEAWYLEGWCFWLMAETARDEGGYLLGEGDAGGESEEEMGWRELARDARDCLETCQMLHVSTQHPDTPLLDHTRELIAKLVELGIEKSPDEEGEWGGIQAGDDNDDDQCENDDDQCEDDDDGDGDVDMK